MILVRLNCITIMLLVANLLKPWHMGTHPRVLSESYPMNTNMTGFRWFSNIFKSLHRYALDESHISIRRVKWQMHHQDDSGLKMSVYMSPFKKENTQVCSPQHSSVMAYERE